MFKNVKNVKMLKNVNKFKNVKIKKIVIKFDRDQGGREPESLKLNISYLVNI